MDNTPASAECFQNEGLAILDDHTEPIPSPQLFRGFVRPRNCVLQAQPIRTHERLRLADPPVWTVGNPHNLPTTDRDAVRLNLCSEGGSVVGAFIKERNHSPQWRELFTRDLQQHGFANGQTVKVVLFDDWM